jgi:hypothetical protein
MVLYFHFCNAGKVKLIFDTSQFEMYPPCTAVLCKSMILTTYDYLQNTITVIKPGVWDRTAYTNFVTRKSRENGKYVKNFGWKAWREEPLGRRRRRWMDNIKMILNK